MLCGKQYHGLTKFLYTRSSQSLVLKCNVVLQEANVIFHLKNSHDIFFFFFTVKKFLGFVILAYVNLDEERNRVRSMFLWSYCVSLSNDIYIRKQHYHIVILLFNIISIKVTVDQNFLYFETTYRAENWYLMREQYSIL